MRAASIFGTADCRLIAAVHVKRYSFAVCDGTQMQAHIAVSG